MGYSLSSTTEKAENVLGMMRAPIKPYLPGISRFLIVATFYEDALRIFWQWTEQVGYLEHSRNFPKYAGPVFLGFNALVSRCLEEDVWLLIGYL